MTATNGTPDGPDGKKAVLFCSVCGYDDAVDGVWAVDDHDERTDIQCPDCGHLVVSQPRFDASAGRDRTMVGPLLQFVDTVVSHNVL
ncbi:MAG: DNA-directed RNA polymerase subunit RPC12/RpoP [Natronomonas sp.]|jgi:DNA-directed RNA polymerase subunit RPC12/RpoP|uniref:hypothetical protein n=1 Tax=Natronomonas sp. TaxID=2184060 RepID=UPI00398946C8